MSLAILQEQMGQHPLRWLAHHLHEQVTLHPLRWPFIFAIPLMLLRFTPFWQPFLRLLLRAGPRSLAVLGAGLSACYLLTSLCYLAYASYADHIEATVACTSWYAV